MSWWMNNDPHLFLKENSSQHSQKNTDTDSFDYFIGEKQ